MSNVMVIYVITCFISSKSKVNKIQQFAINQLIIWIYIAIYYNHIIHHVRQNCKQIVLSLTGIKQLRFSLNSVDWFA